MSQLSVLATRGGPRGWKGIRLLGTPPFFPLAVGGLRNGGVCSVRFACIFLQH